MYATDPSGAQIVGTLMRVEEDPNSRYRFEIWFAYTRQIMNTVSEGAMVAVPNFYLSTEDRRAEWCSVLEIATLLPVHYAIAQDQSGFPGFLEEAARSAAQDWIDQESESTDDTTKIRCVAIPTNLMINEEGVIREDEALPMVGHPARLLNTSMTERLANLDIDRGSSDVRVVGPLIRDPSVSVYVKVEEVLRTHFAVFGFTGAGKSNLLSTLVYEFLEARVMEAPVKLFIFDLMGEFSVLLMDRLCDLPESRLVAVGPETLPESVLAYYSQTPPQRTGQALEVAARDLARTSLYPKRLKERQAEFLPAFRQLLEQDRVRVWQRQEASIGQFVRDRREDFTRGNMGNDRGSVFGVLDRLEIDFATERFTQVSVDRAIQRIRAVNPQTSTGINNLRELTRALEGELNANRPVAPPACRITIPQLVAVANANDNPALTVVQAADPDALREFAGTLGFALYDARRRTGQISPLVSCLFDEADEFIPLNPDKDSSYATSTAIAMTFARRGRKFGLGLGIATQRVTYLNTSIMAQPHTYFISKLPRRSDRERVCEAFGISEDMFRQTFKFRKGNWLLVSHDATGLESVPLPIRTANADERLIQWLEQRPVRG